MWLYQCVDIHGCRGFEMRCFDATSTNDNILYLWPELLVPSKVDEPNLVIGLDRDPIFEWYMVSCGSKNGAQKYICLEDIGDKHNLKCIRHNQLMDTCIHKEWRRNRHNFHYIGITKYIAATKCETASARPNQHGHSKFKKGVNILKCEIIFVCTLCPAP